MTTAHIATVTAPGADSAVSVLYDSTVAGTNLPREDFRTAVVTIANSAIGTLTAYAKNGAGDWVAFWSEVANASRAARASVYAIDIAHCGTIKIEWANGGTAQSTWYASTLLSQLARSEYSDDAADVVVPFVYSGTTPGAVSTAFTLFSSVTSFGANALQLKNLRSIKVSIKCAAIGTLRAYRSNDGGTTWSQFRSEIVPASVASVSDDYLIDISGARDVKIDWLNGGSTQAATWDPCVAVSELSVADLALTGGYSLMSYVGTASNMAATFNGGAIAVGPEGGLRMHVVTTNAAAANGTFTLQTSDDGVTWAEEPSSSTEFTNPASTTTDFVAEWVVQKRRARIVYTRASGGATDTCTVNMHTW